MGKMFGKKNMTGRKIKKSGWPGISVSGASAFESDVLSDVCFGPMNQGMSREEAEAEAKKALLQVGFKVKKISVNRLLNFPEVRKKSCHCRRSCHESQNPDPG